MAREHLRRLLLAHHLHRRLLAYWTCGIYISSVVDRLASLAGQPCRESMTLPVIEQS